MIPRHLLSCGPCLAALFLSASPLPAQIVGGAWETFHHFDGTAAFDSLGLDLAPAGDVDGDGVGDLIAGAPSASPGGRYAAGSAFVFSGATGALLHRFDGPAERDELGCAVDGAGDLNGDGIADLLVGARYADAGGFANTGAVYVFSGADGAVLFRFDGASGSDYLGYSVAGIDDVDGDGVPDLFLGALQADPNGLESAGSAYVRSGATGALILQIDGDAEFDYLGSCLAPAGDLNGDGVGDLLLGMGAADPGGRPSAGLVQVLSGADGSPLLRIEGAEAGGGLGHAAASVGDLDGDGVPELLAGAYALNPGGMAAAGSAFVFSGANGRMLQRFDGLAADDLYGVAVDGAGDVDGDGVPDLLIGAYLSSIGITYSGYAEVRSGADGTLIGRFHGTEFGARLGFAVAGAGDLNGDGLQEIMLGANGASPNGMTLAGSVFVHALDPFLHPSAGQLSLQSGRPVRFDLRFPRSEAGASYALLASASGTGSTTLGGLDVPLSPDPVLAFLVAGGRPAPLHNGFGRLDAQGHAIATLDADPALSPLIGRTLHFAAVSFDAATSTGRFSSVARAVTVLP